MGGVCVAVIAGIEITSGRSGAGGGGSGGNGRISSNPAGHAMHPNPLPSSLGSWEAMKMNSNTTMCQVSAHINYLKRRIQAMITCVIDLGVIDKLALLPG